MAINGRFRVSMTDVFPAGAFVVGVVEAVRDFDKSTPERFVQQRDRQTDLPRNRVAYSLRARAMRAPVKGAKASGSPASPASAEGKAA